MTAHVLIIEDNPDNMELVDYLLKSAGYQPEKACDGAQGLQRIAERCPDLVLCDLQMPVLDGFEVLRHLRSNELTRDIAVIAVTALSMPADKAKVLAAGFNGYLSKPIDPETFVTQIEAYIRFEQRALPISPRC